MARNIEIKARIHSVDALLPRARALADGDAVLIEQDDSFYAVPNGRLKLRRFVGGHAGDADTTAELIHYHRPDSGAARASDYVRVPVSDPDALHEALTRGCGLIGRVQKTRWLLIVGPTRIHLDRVVGLGDFMELEVVLSGATNAPPNLQPNAPQTEAQADARGVAIAESLMHQLGLAAAPRIAGAYLDLLVAAERDRGRAAAAGAAAP